MEETVELGTLGCTQRPASAIVRRWLITWSIIVVQISSGQHGVFVLLCLFPLFHHHAPLLLLLFFFFLFLGDIFLLISERIITDTLLVLMILKSIIYNHAQSHVFELNTQKNAIKVINLSAGVVFPVIINYQDVLL